MDLASLFAFLQSAQSEVAARAWWALAWLVFTFAANLFFRAESGQAAAAWLGARPWGAKALAVCRHWGFDFLGIWDDAAKFFRGNPPPPAFGGAPAVARAPSGLMLPPPPAVHRWAARYALNAIALGLVVSLTGCAAWSSFWTPNRVSAVEDIGECIVLNSAEALIAGPMSPAVEAAVALKCATSPADVHKLITGSPRRVEIAKQHLLEARAAGASR